MNRLLLTVAVLAAIAPAYSQCLADYLKLRKQYHIVQPVGVETLETMIGSRVFEIKGNVKGTFKVGDKLSLMIERADGDTETVEADTLPDWLSGNEVPARLIVEASRASDTSPLRAKLLGAAPESQIAPIEEKAARKQAVLVRKQSPKRLRSSLASRSGGWGRQWTLPASEVTPIYAAFIKGQNRRLSDREATRIAVGVIGFSIKFGIDARLIMAMLMAESGFDPNSRSHSGAMGLGQLMPETAADYGITNPYDSIQNLYGTVRMIRGHLDKYKRQTGQDFDSLVLALAAYNAGVGAVRRHGGVPPYRATQAYVRKVINTYNALCGRA